MADTHPILETIDVSVKLGQKLILQRINFTVPHGEIFGVLGPNGAGKSTLFRTITGLITPHTGSIKIQGHDIVRSRLLAQAQFAYLPGDVRLYGSLTGKDNLEFFGHLHPNPPTRQKEILERLNFDQDDLGKKINNYSSGMRQKIALTIAFQHDPALYILDEPTTGLDPLVQSQVAQLLEEERKQGKTILLSSHTLSEVERVCNQVAILRQGEIVFSGAIDTLKSDLTRQLNVVFSKDVDHQAWEGLPGFKEVTGTSKHHVVTFTGDPKPLLKLLITLPIENVSITDISLEQAFQKYYQESNHV
jgi:ABC-2 type transport system ATP-binding protein